MSDLPPLPKIEGDVDLMLDVYTHSSLRFGGAPMNDDYGDTERLAELGAKVLELTVTNQLYSQRPFLNSKEIQVRCMGISHLVSLSMLWINIRRRGLHWSRMRTSNAGSSYTDSRRSFVSPPLKFIF